MSTVIDKFFTHMLAPDGPELHRYAAMSEIQ